MLMVLHSLRQINGPEHKRQYMDYNIPAFLEQLKNLPLLR